MDVEILQNSSELEMTRPFRVETLLWGTKKIPETYGYMALCRGTAFILKIIVLRRILWDCLKNRISLPGQCDGSFCHV